MDRVRETDQFFVYSKSYIAATDYQSLALLYQPIIGVFAFSLYCTLWNLLNRQTLVSDKYLHTDLESLLNCKISKLEEARRNLEAIGLLNVYLHDDCFAYEIKLPMAPSSFINDGVLGSYLQSCVSEKRYEKILKLFQLAPIAKDGFLNITKAFDEVFPTITEEKPTVQGEFLAPNRAKKVKVMNHSFDFRLFVEGYPEDEKVRRLLNDAIKEKILRLAYVYGLDENAMHTIFAKAAEDDFSAVDPNKLSRYSREWYKTKEITAPVPPMEKVENLLKGQPSDPVSYFSSVSPRELLSHLSGGLVSDADLRIVERLIDEIELDQGVVNVLLAYTLKINEGNMPSYAYYQKIGMAWKRNQIETVEVAMDYVRHLNSEYLRNQDPASAKKTGRNGKPAKPDVEVDWLDDYLKSTR